MGIPLITVGIVQSQDPDGGGLQVLLRTGGQSPTAPVKVGYLGAADALRINQVSLPGVGSWGLIAFPYEDSRNGVWLLTLLPSQIDAIVSLTSGSGPVDSRESFLEYKSHWSGFWNLLDYLGQSATSFPDGSWAVVASGAVPAALPTVYRHTLQSGARIRTPFTAADRVKTSPTAYNLSAYIQGAVSLIASGAVAVQTPSLVVSGSLSSTGNLSAGNGATGSFTTINGQVISVINGIIVNIA